MAIFKQKNSQFWSTRFVHNGQTYVRSTKTSNRRIAEQIAEKIRNGIVLEAATEDRLDVRLADVFKRFMATKMHLAHARQLQFYWNWVASQVDTKDPIRMLTTEVVERLVALRSIKSSQATVKHMVNLLRQLHTYADERKIKVTPIVWPKVVVKNSRQRYLSDQEEKNLLAAMSPDREWQKQGTMTEDQKKGMQKNYDMTLTLIDTGARLSEVLYLKWNDVDMKNGAINLFRSKTSTTTLIKMTKRLREVFERRAASKDSKEWVFPGPSGKPSVRSAHAIRAAFKRAGIENARLHDIRHTLASKLVQNGATLFEVSKILGHSDVRMSQRYSHLEQKAVAEKNAAILDTLNE